MNNPVNLIAFGTFGSPNGFTQTFFAGDSNLQNSVKPFDIRGPILIYPESALYSIRKEYKNGYNMIAYSIYTYAQEPTSPRRGSFIGSSILFVDEVAEEIVIINNLNEFHENLKRRNVKDDVIMVNHSENFDVKNCRPRDFDKIGYHLRKIDNLNFVQNSNKQLVVYCETSPNELQSFLKKSIDLLNVYDTIYFTQSGDVAKFVRSKGIFVLVDKNGFENEIKKLAADRYQKNQILLNELLIEKQKLEVSKKKLINEYEKHIEQNEKQYQEIGRKINESKNEINNIIQKYETYDEKIDELINSLKGGEKSDKVRQAHDQNKIKFINSINRQEKKNESKDIKKLQKTVELEEHYDDNNGIMYFGKQNHIFKLSTFVLLFLWVLTLVYFMVFNKPKISHANKSQEIPAQIESKKAQPKSNGNKPKTEQKTK